jgi:hypothetical protein
VTTASKITAKQRTAFSEILEKVQTALVAINENMEIETNDDSAAVDHIWNEKLDAAAGALNAAYSLLNDVEFALDDAEQETDEPAKQ